MQRSWLSEDRLVSLSSANVWANIMRARPSRAGACFNDWDAQGTPKLSWKFANIKRSSRVCSFRSAGQRKCDISSISMQMEEKETCGEHTHPASNLSAIWRQICLQDVLTDPHSHLLRPQSIVILSTEPADTIRQQTLRKTTLRLAYLARRTHNIVCVHARIYPRTYPIINHKIRVWSFLVSWISGPKSEARSWAVLMGYPNGTT